MHPIVGALSRISATALIWLGAALLGGADLISAGVVPGVHPFHFALALGLAVAAGIIFCLAVSRAVISRNPDVYPAGSRGLGGRVLGWSEEAIKHEAEWGVRQFELYLSRQNTNGSGPS